MSEPYDTHTHGSLTLAGSNEIEQVETLNSIFRHATTQGWQVGIHATGDETISAIADAAEQNPEASKLRNYVIHADLVKSQDMRRLGNSGVCINVQPGIRRMVGRAVEPIIGRARTVRRLRLREMKEAGINLAIMDTPMAKQASEVHKLTIQHNQIHFERWREVQVRLAKQTSEKISKATKALLAAFDSEEAVVIAKQRSAAKPVKHQFELVGTN